MRISGTTRSEGHFHSYDHGRPFPPFCLSDIGSHNLLTSQRLYSVNQPPAYVASAPLAPESFPWHFMVSGFPHPVALCPPQPSLLTTRLLSEQESALPFTPVQLLFQIEPGASLSWVMNDLFMAKPNKQSQKFTRAP